MRKYKVWGGLTFKKGKQVRTIIATKTKKRAKEILLEFHNIKQYYFCDYWCETSNSQEIELALSKPETIFYVDNHKRRIK